MAGLVMGEGSVCSVLGGGQVGMGQTEGGRWGQRAA